MKKLLAVCLAAALLVPFKSPIQARDNGQWTNTDPEIKKWFQSLRMPDNPAVSCCGEGDGYWCDDIHVSSGQPGDEGIPKGATYCRITDDRDDNLLKRTHVPIGTAIQIPNRKFNKDSNPIGHALVFMQWYGDSLSTGEKYAVYCFISPGGV